MSRLILVSKGGVLWLLKVFLPSAYFSRYSQTRIYVFRHLIMQKIFRINGHVPWPVHPNSVVTNTKNIKVGVDCAPGYEHGCYIQGIGTIEIGDYTQVGPNVGIISANHNIYDSRLHNESSVKIGKYCWLGFGSLILPGVTLGDFVIVAGNATVTKSFEYGYVVVAGNPAKVVKRLDPSACKRYENEHKYIGFSRVS